jgi:hypothetical protein
LSVRNKYVINGLTSFTFSIDKRNLSKYSKLISELLFSE